MKNIKIFIVAKNHEDFTKFNREMLIDPYKVFYFDNEREAVIQAIENILRCFPTVVVNLDNDGLLPAMENIKKLQRLVSDYEPIYGEEVRDRHIFFNPNT